MPHADDSDEDMFQDQYGNQSGRKDSLSMNSLDILSVNQLLESVCLISVPFFLNECAECVGRITLGLGWSKTLFAQNFYLILWTNSI